MLELANFPLLLCTVFNIRMRSQSSSPKPKLVSLFCGAGGLDLGFSQAGFDVCFAADYDKAAVESYNNNHPGRLGHVIDLLDTTPQALYEKVRSVCGDESVLAGIIGGPPCQGFSRGNVARSQDDPRNKLVFRYAEIVNLFSIEFGIKFFVFENVPEIKAKKNNDLLAELRLKLSENFNIFEKELNSRCFQVAQSRRRLFIVGVHKSLDLSRFEFPEPSLLREKVVSDVIRGLPAPAYYAKSIMPCDIPYHPNHWTMRPKSKRFVTGVMPTGGRSFIKLEWDKPSRTVAYGNREIHVHPDGMRRVSIYEALRLQGFPESYVLLGNLSEQVRQVSNAVPPPVAEEIAKSVMEQIM
ncbi:DNA cytosine methyltransferase [Pseudomonas sp. S1(2024)]|uniref:DNA cytosine methyltransferase n=1 Tax=Pseudomonas sp. S1(2024) TaxID=3390191 RepID=UPI00397DE89A